VVDRSALGHDAVEPEEEEVAAVGTVELDLFRPLLLVALEPDAAEVEVDEEAAAEEVSAAPVALGRELLPIGCLRAARRLNSAVPAPPASVPEEEVSSAGSWLSAADDEEAEARALARPRSRYEEPPPLPALPAAAGAMDGPTAAVAREARRSPPIRRR
jgi:hypothetical protein